MIIVRIDGGLGNQLFQYSFGRYLAERNQCQLVLDISPVEEAKLHPYGLEHFNIEHSLITDRQRKQALNARKASKKRLLRPLLSLFSGGMSYASESKFSFCQESLAIGNNSYVDGYWQSEKYFLDVAGKIRSELTLKGEQSDYFEAIRNNIKRTSSIALHIRRGDYISNPKASEIYSGVSVEHYQNAVNVISERVAEPVFFIFSDDIAWVKQNLRISHPAHYIDHPDRSCFYEEMILMAHCQHNIVANSTFSWWGAWLNDNDDKIVIAPKEWFKTDTLSDKDLVPESWIRL